MTNLVLVFGSMVAVLVPFAIIAVLLVLFIRRMLRKRAILHPVTQPAEAAHTHKIVSPQQAGRRALCLGAMLQRAGAEAAKNSSVPAQLIDWLRQEGLRDSLSASERALLDRPAGTWGEQELAEVAWRVEALAAIEWAMGLHAILRPYDLRYDQQMAFSPLPLLQPTADFIAQATLRNEYELRQARDVAAFWLQEARTAEVQTNYPQIPHPPQMGYEEVVGQTAQHRREQLLFEALHGESPSFGTPRGPLTRAALASTMRIAAERLGALNWLCGHRQDWDNR